MSHQTNSRHHYSISPLVIVETWTFRGRTSQQPPAGGISSSLPLMASSIRYARRTIIYFQVTSNGCRIYSKKEKHINDTIH